MSSKKKSPSKVLLALGLTSMMTTGVRCGPCLKIALPDTGDTGDTGAIEEDSSKQSADAGSRASATQRVLERGILPEDVVTILAAKKDQEPPGR